MSQMFPPVRLAALDLDGTLLNHEGQVTPRTRAALQAASDRGVVIVPTTLPYRPDALTPGFPSHFYPVSASPMPSPPTVLPYGTWAATRWVLSTAGTPMRPSARPVSPPVCCAA